MTQPYEAMTRGIDMDALAALVLEKEKELRVTVPDDAVMHGDMVMDGGTALGAHSMTARHGFYNLLSWDSPLIPQLFDQIRLHYIDYLAGLDKDAPTTWIKMWANVLRSGEFIAPHVHADDENYGYLGGHISVACNDSSTYYVYDLNVPIIYESINVVGQISIFPSNVMHYTSIVNGDDERITVAFDLFTEKQYANLPEGFKSNLLTLIE